MMHGRQEVKLHAFFKFDTGCSLFVSLILPNILQGGAVTECPIPTRGSPTVGLFVTSGYLYCSDSELAEATISLACG